MQSPSSQVLPGNQPTQEVSLIVTLQIEKKNVFGIISDFLNDLHEMLVQKKAPNMYQQHFVMMLISVQPCVENQIIDLFFHYFCT